MTSNNDENNKDINNTNDNKEEVKLEEKENNQRTKTQSSKVMSKEELNTLPSYEYIRITVQKEIQQGLLYISKNNPKNPIKFLGEFLIEKSKNYNA